MTYDRQRPGYVLYLAVIDPQGPPQQVSCYAASSNGYTTTILYIPRDRPLEYCGHRYHEAVVWQGSQIKLISTQGSGASHSHSYKIVNTGQTYTMACPEKIASHCDKNPYNQSDDRWGHNKHIVLRTVLIPGTDYSVEQYWGDVYRYNKDTGIYDIREAQNVFLGDCVLS